MNIYLKYFLIGLSIIAGLFIIGFIAFYLMVASAFGAFDKTYSKQELIEVYSKNELKIEELTDYYSTIVPKNKVVAIEFENDDKISRLQINDTLNSNIIQNWDFYSDELFDGNYKNDLGWTKEQVKILKQKLDDADCISIENGEPMEIGFKRSGLGMYSFALFKNEKSDRSYFIDNCMYIFTRKNVALQFGGGAVGPQCFPENY